MYFIISSIRHSNSSDNRDEITYHSRAKAGFFFFLVYFVAWCREMLTCGRNMCRNRDATDRW